MSCLLRRSVGKSKKRNLEYQSAQRKGRERGHNTCQICGSTDHVEEHHLIDHQYGGGADVDNIVALCRECHKDYPFDKRKIISRS